jgi:hypothetical protein
MLRSLSVASLLLAAILGLSGGTTPTSGDVTAHGAKGDGTTDDTAAIAKAIASKAGLINFPRGTYRITKTIEIPLDKVGFTSLEGHGVARVVMAGPGPAFRFVGTHEGTAAPRTVKANVWANQRTPCIDGLEIVGDHKQACGVEATGTMQLTLTRLVVRHCLHAVHLTKRNRNVIIDSCHLYDNRGVGVYYDDVNLHQSNIVACHISYNSGGGVVTRKGDVRNIQIAGCDLEDNVKEDGPETANVLIDSRDSTSGTGEVAITGCTIQHGREAKGSANIRVIGRSRPLKDMPVVRQGHVTITGNVLSDVQINIHLVGCRGVTVTGNTMWEGFDHNLLVEGCHSVVVGPNNLDRNPYYEHISKRKPQCRVAFRDCEACTVSGLHVTEVRGGPGLLMKGCKRLNLSGCTLLDCAEGGVVMEDCHDCLLSGFVVRADAAKTPKPSLTVKGGKGNVVAGSVLLDGTVAPKEAVRVVGW